MSFFFWKKTEKKSRFELFKEKLEKEEKEEKMKKLGEELSADLKHREMRKALEQAKRLFRIDMFNGYIVFVPQSSMPYSYYSHSFDFSGRDCRVLEYE